MDNETSKDKQKYYFVPYYTNGSGFFGIFLYYLIEKLFSGKNLKVFLKKAYLFSVKLTLLFLIFLIGWFSFSILIPSLEVSGITLDDILKRDIADENLMIFINVIDEKLNKLWR